ncbi:MAG: hypothetical protein EXX96DRAFT_347783 [Benjaminiella poitrasii]|nr:MAG: hypothetical protein EXX96DRAFT_347783 [Benjaminiella poitrasii]
MIRIICLFLSLFVSLSSFVLALNNEINNNSTMTEKHVSSWNRTIRNHSTIVHHHHHHPHYKAIYYYDCHNKTKTYEITEGRHTKRTSIQLVCTMKSIVTTSTKNRDNGNKSRTTKRRHTTTKTITKQRTHKSTKKKPYKSRGNNNNSKKSRTTTISHHSTEKKHTTITITTTIAMTTTDVSIDTTPTPTLHHRNTTAPLLVPISTIIQHSDPNNDNSQQEDNNANHDDSAATNTNAIMTATSTTSIPTDNNNSKPIIANTDAATNDVSNKALGIGLGVGIGCAAVLGLAALAVLHKRNKKHQTRDMMIEQQQQGVSTRWRPQSFMGVVASVVSRLPRTPSQRSKASAITDESIGVAVGHGEGAAEVSSQPPPFSRIS